MPSFSAHVAQTQPGPAPGPDPGAVVNALTPERLFGDLLLRLTAQLTEALQTIWDELWHSGANVFTYTAPELTYRFGPVADLLFGMRLLIGAVTAVGVVVAALALAGREVFGWGDDLGGHLGRLGLAATLANGSFVWVQLAINLNNRLCEAIGGSALSIGLHGAPVDTLSSGLLLLALLWFGLQLGLKMLYRIGMLWVLIAVAPLALACWAIPQTQWIATTWTRHFVGWTFGQVLVTIALKLGFAVGPFGPSGASEAGLIFGIVMAMLAVDLPDLLVYGSPPRFGAVRGATYIVRSAMHARTAFASAYARAGSAGQRRLPGF